MPVPPAPLSCLLLSYHPLLAHPIFQLDPFHLSLHFLALLLFFFGHILPPDARVFAQPMAIQMRQPGAPGGAPIILAPRLPPPQMHVATSQAAAATSMAMNGGAPPPLVSPGPGEHAGLMYNPYGAVSALGTVTSAAMPSPMDPYGLGAAGAPSIIEYQTHLDQAQAGMLALRRDFVTGM